MSVSKIVRAFVFYWFPWLAYLWLIFFLSSQSQPDIGFEIAGRDKYLHFLEYLVLHFLTARAFCFDVSLNKFKKVYFISFVFVLIWGISDEFHQYFVPERNASITDWLADFLGAFVSWLITKYLLLRENIIKIK